MRKRMRFKKNMLIKNAAYSVILCMIIGSIYMPVFAEEEDENKPPVSEIGDAVSEDLVNEADKPNDDSEGDEKTERNIQEEKDSEDENDIEEQKPEDENDNKEAASHDDIRTEESEEKEKRNDKQELPEIVNVVVPTTYILALNPYSLPIRIGEDEITTEQVISGTYGIVNKSSTDQIVKVSLTVEDMNDGELVFVDSAEEARNAEENVYAVYLAAVPADEEEVLVEGLPADENIVGESLQNVSMVGAQEQAVTLYAGMNQIAFKLSGAVYSAENDEEAELDDLDDDALKDEPEMVLSELAPGGSGVTAYTFWGAMNPNAAWEKLSGGIKISVVYTYQTADGSEETIEGTGAMIRID